MSKSADPAQATARSPFAGCAILIAVVLVMVFLIGFSVLTLFRQYGEIEKFTQLRPAPIEVVSLENREAEVNQLAERLEQFRQELDGEEAVSLALSPADLNLAIAMYGPLEELRGTFRVLSLEKDGARIAISFPLNGKPRLAREGEEGFVTSDTRYLNATLVAEPALSQKEIVLRLKAIEVPGAAVPREFIEQMSPYRLTERYLTHAILGPAMAKLTSLKVEDGQLVLLRTPGELPAGSITDEDVRSASNRLFRFFGIGASIFLVLVGIVLFIGIRAKDRQR